MGVYSKGLGASGEVLHEGVLEESQQDDAVCTVEGPPGSGKTCFFSLWAGLCSLKDKEERPHRPVPRKSIQLYLDQRG